MFGFLPGKILAICLVSTALLSCKKEDCQKCLTITVSGRVIDSSSGKGIDNVPVEVYWTDKSGSYFSSNIDIAHTKTLRDGTFTLHVDVDTSLFRNTSNHLYVSALIPHGYIADGYSGDPVNQAYVIDESISPYVNTTDIRFTLFQKTDVTIELVRNQADMFQAFDLHYYYDFTQAALYFHYGPPPVAFTSFKRSTAANVFTKVTWRKVYAPGQFSYFIDSIKCVPNGNNKIYIGY